MFLMCFYILGKKKKPRDLINCVLKKKKTCMVILLIEDTTDDIDMSTL